MRRAILTILSGAALTACASNDLDPPHAGGGAAYGDYAYGGRDWRDRRLYEGPLAGPGVAILDPWLKETPEGRAVVTLGFRDAAGGEVSEDVAHRANIWFRRYADSDRDMRLTDPEIRTALVAAAGRYLHR